MTSYKPSIATVPPPTLQKQLEVLAAARSLATQDDEFWRQRRAEIAAIRRDAGKLVVLHLELQRQYGEFVEWVQEERRRRDPRLRSHVIKYNADQPRVPAGSPHGGEWTSGGGASTNDAGNAPASGAAHRPEREPQYAQASTGTMTDGGGNVSAAAAQQHPNFWHDLPNVLIAPFRDYSHIPSNQIPADSPKHPVQFVDSFGQPILDDQGKPLVRPADLPPETYVQAGMDARSLPEQLKQFKQEVEKEINNPNEQSELALGGLAAAIVKTLFPFLHAGSFDAERFDSYYVPDYRHYTSIALGIFMAAAGVIPAFGRIDSVPLP